MKIVRLYLAYMKDQSANICIDGNTPTSIKMVLAPEGLPTDPDHLLRIFADVHQEYGVGQLKQQRIWRRIVGIYRVSVLTDFSNCGRIRINSSLPHQDHQIFASKDAHFYGRTQYNFIKRRASKNFFAM